MKGFKDCVIGGCLGLASSIVTESFVKGILFLACMVVALEVSRSGK
jgi:hypothetical protein